MHTQLEFEGFIQEHSAVLLRLAWLLTQDEHSAQDLVQQTLIRMYERWERIDGSRFAYARRILVNLRIDRWRATRHEVLVGLERTSTASAADTHDVTVDRLQLQQGLATLTGRQRRVLVLRYYLDLSEREVAADLGVSVGTVKATASRATAHLRAFFADPTTVLSSEGNH